MDHDINRTRICVLCLKYQCEMSAYNRRKPKTVKLTAAKEATIKAFFVKNYDFLNDSWPSVVCQPCNSAITAATRGIFARKITKYEYKMKTRPRSAKCDCFFCDLVNKAKARSPVTFKKLSKRPPVKLKYLCSKCLSEIRKGSRHKCTKATLVERSKLILKENHVDGPVIAQLIKDHGSDTMTLRNLRGKPRLLYLNKPKEIEPITPEDFNDLHKNFTGSEKKTSQLLTKLRRKGVPIAPKILPVVQNETSNVQEFFAVIEESMEIGNESNKQQENRTVVYCHRLFDFIQFVLSKRDIVPSHDVLLKFSTDDGGKFLKMCMTIVAKSDCSDEKSGKLTSVKRLFIVCMAENTPESNFNLKKMTALIGLADITGFELDVWFVGDYKIQNKSVGIQDAGCTFPCYLFDAHKARLDSEDYNLRTFGSIREWNKKWIDSGANKKTLPNYFSCISTPIFTDTPDECPINEFFVMGELHLLLRVTNNLIEQIVKIDETNLNDWLKKLGVLRQGAFAAFKGNQCKTIIEKGVELSETLIEPAKHYGIILAALNRLVDDCFGQTLNSKWEQSHEIFFSLLKQYDIKLTPSMHVLKYHVPEFIANNQSALGLYSEQAGESIHGEWQKFWEKFKNASNDTKDYALLRAVAKFNYLSL